MLNLSALANGFLIEIQNRFNILPSLYVLTDDQFFSHSLWPERVEQVILGGASIIQLREKTLSDQALLPYAQSIQDICRNYHIPLIINDRVELAHRLNADGIHLGKHDSSLRHAREYLGHDIIIGISCYRNIFNAIRAQNMGADYVAFGSVFSSPTKKKAPRCPLSIITQATRLLDIPICAIGGINARNAHHAVKSGASLIATTHAVFNANDPKSAATKVNQQVIMRG